MDINNLKAFIVVADRQSFSRSAETLNLTQPAVSKRIAALESELATKLFDRVGRNVRLTEAGQMLLPTARQINNELSRITDVICNLGDEISGTLSIGTTEHIGAHRLPPILTTFRETYPNVEIDLHFESSCDNLCAVENGAVEIALCCTKAATQRQHSKLRQVEVWNDDLVVVVARDHELNTGTRVSLETLTRTPAILQPQSATTRQSIEQVFKLHDLTTNVGTEANDFETVRSMTSIGLGWACLPSFQLDDSLATLQVDELKLAHSVALVQHHDRTLSRAAAAFIDSLPLGLPRNYS